MHEHLLNPELVPRLLKIVRATLFPNNAPGPPKRVPDAAETIAIRRRCAETIVGAVPRVVLVKYFNAQRTSTAKAGDGVDDEEDVLVSEVEDVLGVLGDAYLNKHLVYNIIELIVVRLLPEMGEKGVQELMKERIGDDKE